MPKLKMFTLILILYFITGFLTGCTNDMNRREIDEINFIHVMGIDYSAGEFILTAVYSSDQGADAEKGEAGKEEISQGRGASAYEAFTDLRLKNKKTVSIANTGYFLIGEMAALHGIDKCIDFLSRDETVKMESLIFVTKDTKAADFINQSLENEQVIHEDLEAIEQKQKELVKRNDNTLVNILNEIEDSMTGMLIPYLISENNSFLLQGYAVFDEGRLTDYLDTETSSGVNFIKNIIRAFPIYLEDNVSLSVVYSKCKLKSSLDNDQITVRIKLDFETMVKEINTETNIFTEKELNNLANKQNEYIAEIMKRAVNYSVHNKLDILQIARLIQNQHSKKWHNYEENWENALTEVQYEYEINSKITKSFILNN